MSHFKVALLLYSEKVCLYSGNRSKRREKKMMYQYWLISYNKCTTLMQDVINKINWGWGYGNPLYFLLTFFYKPKTAIKKKKSLLIFLKGSGGIQGSSLPISGPKHQYTAVCMSHYRSEPPASPLGQRITKADLPHRADHHIIVKYSNISKSLCEQ